MQDAQATLFIAEEPFLPPGNGSSQVYLSVAENHRRRGGKSFCICFYKDADHALSAEVWAAYAQRFDGHLMLPGWNGGGGLRGKAGLAWREARRWITGDVFSGHPFLHTKRRGVAEELASLIRHWQVQRVYCHKVNALQMFAPVLDRLPGLPVTLDLHDDFVRKAADYDHAYARLFHELPAGLIAQQHGFAWLRHRFRRAREDRSRAVELRFLNRCEEVVIASDEEAERYASFPELRQRVVHRPWHYLKPVVRPPSGTARFDIGFIGSEDVMNLDAVAFLRDEILPLLRRQKPDVTVLLAGTLAEKARPMVESVPEIHIRPHTRDVGEFYADIAVPVVPLRFGTGVSIKVLEAMAFGKPIVSTRIGVRGLPHDAVRGIDVADAPDSFAEAVLRRLRPVATAPE
ncbi:glycosyltransferase [Pseudoroseomonas globiformis]|uniref:Glycosyltransferase n=1 Tax=Teichococcus globiformis TaxID=2307229 RepID=A0ABV7FYY2_9PROT